MNSKTKTLSIIALVVPFAITSSVAFAAEPVNKEALKEALESGNYQEWMQLLPEDHKLSDQVTEENFDRFAEAVSLMHEGSGEAAKAIFDELGIERPMKKGHKKDVDPEKREAMKAALESGDYQAWLELVPEDAPIREKVDEETFKRMVEAHELMEAGDKEGAKAIMEELDIKPPHRGKRGGEKVEKMEEMKEILESGDYQAWLELVPEDHPLTTQVTESNFGQFVEAHNLMRDGEIEGAKEVFDELGIERPQKKGGKIRGKIKDRVKGEAEGVEA